MNKFIYSAAFLSLLLCAAPHSVKCQGLIETMTAQIAKLDLYLQETKHGYDLVNKGLTTIGDIKNGDFNLHTLFFNTLSTVSPGIKNWTKVADIIEREAQIVEGCTKSIQQLTRSNAFSRPSMDYLTAVFTQLQNLTGKDVDELSGLLTDGQWHMDDEDRMERIDLLYNAVTDKYNFLISFSARVATLIQNIAQQKANLLHLQTLHQP